MQCHPTPQVGVLICRGGPASNIRNMIQVQCMVNMSQAVRFLSTRWWGLRRSNGYQCQRPSETFPEATWVEGFQQIAGWATWSTGKSQRGLQLKLTDFLAWFGLPLEHSIKKIQSRKKMTLLDIWVVAAWGKSHKRALFKSTLTENKIVFSFLRGKFCTVDLTDDYGWDPPHSHNLLGHLVTHCLTSHWIILRLQRSEQCSGVIFLNKVFPTALQLSKMPVCAERTPKRPRQVISFSWAAANYKL